MNPMLCVSAGVLLLGGSALANPTPTNFVELPNCDPLTGPLVCDELGIGFPPDELINAASTFENLPACPMSDIPALINSVVVMTNLTGRRFTDVWYVVDPETTISNLDGTVNGMSAFRIDSVGLNIPLIGESIIADQIWQPGETWTFIIDDYLNLLGLPASAIGSIGVPSPGDPTSSGSIIAIPAPGALLLLGMAGAVAARRRRG